MNTNLCPDYAMSYFHVITLQTSCNRSGYSWNRTKISALHNYSADEMKLAFKVKNSMHCFVVITCLQFTLSSFSG